MRRTLAVSLALLFFWAAPGRPADDDDDTFEDIEIATKKISEWVKILQDKEAPLKNRKAALVIMGIANPKRPTIVPALVGALRRDADPEIRRGAALTLGQIKPPTEGAVDGLGQAAKGDEAPLVRAAAATALGRIGPGAKLSMPSLLAALKDAQPGPRAAAAEALGLIGADPEETVPLLIDALADSDAAVRLNVVTSLGRFGVKASRAAGPLGEIVVKDKDADVRKKAAESLAMMGPAAKVASAGLAEALQKETKSAEVRRWAAIALGKIGPEAKEAAPMLAVILGGVLDKEPDQFVRSHTVRALGKLGKDAIPSLQKTAQNDLVVEVRLAAIEELGAIGPMANEESVVKLLTALQRDSRGVVREAAATALKRVQGKDVAEPKDKDKGKDKDKDKDN